MKYLGLAISLLLCVLVFGLPAYGQCSGGKINGEFHTSCYPWDNTSPHNDGFITGTTTHNDTKRLQRAIDEALGKLIFDEGDYFIDCDLKLYPYRTLEGTGRAVYFAPPTPTPLPSPTPTPAAPSYPSSKIIQTHSGKAIFRIGEDVTNVSIRNLALESGLDATGTMGILFEGGDVANHSSLYFEFSNMTFYHLYKGIYVNAIDDPPGAWQADNVRLDHASFEYCDIGIHINSNNSGWDIDSVDFIVPPGDDFDPDHPLADGQTFAIALEKSTYTSMNLLIGNGNHKTPATGFVYVNQHGNLRISNSVDEGFKNSYYIQGNGRTNPIFLANNYIQSALTVKDSTLVSTANQFHSAGMTFVPATASGVSQVYSYGDKFCREETGCPNRTYDLEDSATIISSADQDKITSTVPNFINYDTNTGIPALSLLAPTNAGGPLLRLGRGAYWFDIYRSETDGSLYFQGNTDGYSQYVFDTHNGGKVTLNNDGSVTYGTVTYSNLGAANGSSVNGTVVYCSNCTKATPCASGGSGALAKLLHGTWDCD